MRELEPDRRDDDGTRVLLRDAVSGEIFSVLINDRLRHLLSHSHRPPTGRDSDHRETTMEADLTPREIQTRIRRGESVAEVAESAGVSVESVEPFAGPVLAERAYMAEQARTTTIRRRHVGGSGVGLGAALDERMAADGLVPEDVRWDAWRREDGRWTITATPPGAQDPATFVFDVRGRYVLPDDAIAHDLVGDVALPGSDDMDIADAVRADAGRTREPAPAAPEPSRRPSLAAGVPTAADLAEPDTDAPSTVPAATVASLKEARDRRAMGQLSITDLPDVPSVDEPSALDHGSAHTPPTHRQPVAASTSKSHGSSEVAPDTEVDDVEQPTGSDDSRGRRKPERRRVPSWDEIMFGGKDA